MELLFELLSLLNLKLEEGSKNLIAKYQHKINAP